MSVQTVSQIALVHCVGPRMKALHAVLPSPKRGEWVETAAELLPTGYQIKLIGQAEEFGKTQKYMSFTFLLAMTLLYMVLASQFNSFLQPAIVMLAQPLAIVGGVAALWLTGQTLNIYSMIGLVLLIGLVAKNSILLVDLTNQRRGEGLKVDAALRNACPTRMRPVLMTSMTVILALAPAAMGFGAGSRSISRYLDEVIFAPLPPEVVRELDLMEKSWQKEKQV